MPLPMVMAKGFAIMPNDEAAEPAGASCGIKKKANEMQGLTNVIDLEDLLSFSLSLLDLLLFKIPLVRIILQKCSEILTMLNARMMHDCDWSGDGELNSGLGELFGVEADDLWNFISFEGSGDPEDTLLNIVSVPLTMLVCEVCVECLLIWWHIRRNNHEKCTLVAVKMVCVPFSSK